MLIGRTGHWITAIAVAVTIALPGMFGLWQPTMETLALMLVAVAISVLIGVPLGVAAGLNRRFYAFLRPVLDAMQTVPSTAYLVPAVLFFGIGPVPAAVATVVYAMAPVVRLTALGIRQVPVETVEAGHVFGSTRRQLLFKVQLPAGRAVDHDRASTRRSTWPSGSSSSPRSSAPADSVRRRWRRSDCARRGAAWSSASPSSPSP